MYVVVAHGWQNDEGIVAKIIADALGTVVFEARQKISDGGPAVIASFADSERAKNLAASLSKDGVPSLVIDPEAVRSNPPLYVCNFVFGPQALQIELFDGQCCEINYSTVQLLLVATCNSGSTQSTAMKTERKFSIGKTLLAGGVPMTKKVEREKTVYVEERDEVLLLSSHEHARVIFGRATLNYDGLGDAMQLTRDLNFTYLKSELQRRAPLATFDDRLLKRAAMVRLLGPAFNPETDHDLAFEILARSLIKQ